jgi:hypothetical protein
LRSFARAWDGACAFTTLEERKSTGEIDGTAAQAAYEPMPYASAGAAEEA